MTLADPLALVTGPDSPMTVSKAMIRGVEYDVFTHAPNDMRDFFSFSNTHFKEREFLIYEDERLTFGEVQRRAVSLAKSLIDLGVQPSDRVAISMRNYPEYCVAIEAILAVGAVAVTLNAWWKSEEIEYGLIDSGSRFAFVDHERWPRFVPSRSLLELGVAITRPEGALPESLLSMADLMEPDNDEAFPPLDIDTDSDALIMYTSGSTDRPKGVVLTHRSIVNSLLNFTCAGLPGLLLGPSEEIRQETVQWLKGGADSMNDPLAAKLPRELMLVNVPFFHVSGLHTMLFLSYRAGRTLVLMYKWNAEKALQLVERESLTKMEGVPTMTGEILHSPDLEKRDLSSLIGIGGGGAARPPEHVKLMQERLPHVIPSVGYGMTETNAAGTVIGGADYLARPTSVGRPIAPLVAMEIRRLEGERGSGIDFQHGDMSKINVRPRALGPHEEGEICMKSSAFMRCYWNQPQETLEALRDGWLHSGDLGHLDEEGFLYITGRAKDIIIRGGENIACGEIEYVLHEHPSVNEAAVHGAPDERLGEIVCATIYLRTGCSATEEEIQDHVRSRLAAFKVPEHVHFVENRLPRIASGKFDKLALKQLAMDRLHASH